MDEQLQKLVSSALNSWIRRAVAFVAGLVLVVLGNKFGLALSDGQVVGVVGLVSAYVFQSAYHQVAKVKVSSQIATALATSSRLVSALEAKPGA